MTAALDPSTPYGDTNHHLAVAVTELIAGYTPQMVSRPTWDQIAEFTRSAVTDLAPRNRGEAHRLLGAIAGLAAWSAETACVSLDRAIVFDGRYIDAYMARGFVSRGSKNNAETIKRRLHRAAVALGHGVAERRARKLRVSEDAAAPYSTAQLRGFRAQVRGGYSDQQRHNWLAVLSLACGAGLTSGEIFRVTRDDIRHEDGIVSITVTGTRARQAVVAEDWEDAVLTVGSSPLLEDDGHLFITSADRDKVPSTVIAQWLDRTAKYENRYVPERLRSTWIVQRLRAGITPKQLMTALRLTSLTSIARLMKYVDEPDSADLAVQLRKAAA